MQNEYYDILNEIGKGTPNASQYKRLASITVVPSGVEQICGLDPFSPRYARAAMDLYLTIRGGEKSDYQSTRDELAPAPLPENLFTELVPWSFRDPTLLSEFLLSWGHMMQVLDIQAGSPCSILEYGPGTGQLLLMLARLGFNTYGVDINVDAVAAIEAQALKMGVSIQMEQGTFGEGFDGELFDRIIFFEAFHHEFYFMDLLRRLRLRLKPGGKLVFCGEPIVRGLSSSIPYPWGPRLDGLSAFCIQRFGWMELGFNWSFMREALRRTGWQVRAFPMPNCGRADCYVATPAESLKIGEVWRLDCGEAASLSALEGGWSSAEGTHRWTLELEAYVVLPAHDGVALSVKISLGNYLPVAKSVTVACGDQIAEVTIPPDTRCYEVTLPKCVEGLVSIQASLHRVSDIISESGDARVLGIAVLDVRGTSISARNDILSG